MRAVIYGAGNIGRGFISRLFSESGYEITFIDVTAPLVDSLNREKRYPVRLLSPDSARDVWIENVSAVNGADTEKTIEAIAGADIMATAVGVRILPVIAPVIAKGLKKRFGRNQKPLNIIICENLINADQLLRKLINENLDDGERKIADERTGLIEASIGCMVPIQTEMMKDGNALRICTENYSRIPVDKKAFKGEIPEIRGMEAHESFGFFIERKLFIHNMGHGICAYFGLHLGDEYIWETVNRPEILFMAENAMLESALALSEKYKTGIKDLHSHIADLLRRFSNKSLGDTCLRVGADTARKLGEEDRFMGAIKCCRETNIKPLFISAGAAAAVFQHIKENGAVQSPAEAAKILVNISNQGSDVSEMIIGMYSRLCEKNALQKITGHIMSLW